MLILSEFSAVGVLVAPGHFQELGLQAASLRELSRRDAQVERGPQEARNDRILMHALRGQIEFHQILG